MPVRKLEMVHFQLTKRCNLHCWFCGQWGEHGAFRGKAGQAMTTEDWLNVVDSLQAEADKGSEMPAVMLWGGEPLLSESFAPVVQRLHAAGAPLGMVTNGTLLDSQLFLCQTAFKRIYVSIDGLPEVHDAIRGQGVYAKVSENLRKLKSSGEVKVTLMSVLTPELAQALPETLKAFEGLQPDEVLLQTRIGLTEQEIQHYRQWMMSAFGQEVADISSWQLDAPLPPLPLSFQPDRLPQCSFPVRVMPHGKDALRAYCLSPLRHAHIAWNGQVGFCTDFTDFTLGDVRETSLPQLFASPLAQRFASEVQAGNCATCEHCSWRNSADFSL